jgi:hypothetical protein
MPITSASVSHASALWRVAVPSIVASAGAAGAMLTLTLLRPTVLTLYGGHTFVLHDPLGLVGERLLAHIHRALAAHPAPPAATCRWVTVQRPLALVWEAMAELQGRGLWRGPRGHWPPNAARVPRVAEARPAAGASACSAPPDVPRVLLVSESDRADALVPAAAARLLLRATRHDWAVFAVTRDGPARRAEPSLPRAPRAPRTHLVCRAGALSAIETPVPVARND